MTPHLNHSATCKLNFSHSHNGIRTKPIRKHLQFALSSRSVAATSFSPSSRAERKFTYNFRISSSHSIPTHAANGLEVNVHLRNPQICFPRNFNTQNYIFYRFQRTPYFSGPIPQHPLLNLISSIGGEKKRARAGHGARSRARPPSPTHEQYVMIRNCLIVHSTIIIQCL